MHTKFVQRIHEIYLDKYRNCGKIEAKRWLSDTLPEYQDFLEVREYTFKVLSFQTNNKNAGAK